MDVFSPTVCDDINRGIGTQSERNSWFYQQIAALKAGVASVSTQLDALAAKVGNNDGAIAECQKNISAANARLVQLSENFNKLSSDNISFKTELTASFDDLSKLVAVYNGNVSKLAADVASNTNRITQLEANLNPDLLKALQTKLEGIGAQIDAAVAAQVAEAMGKYSGQVNAQIKAQNEVVATASDTATNAVDVASKALSAASKASSDLSTTGANLSGRIDTVNSNLALEATTREKADIANANAVAAEAKSRENADRDLGSQIDNTNKALKAESDSRIAADEQASGLTKKLSEKVDANKVIADNAATDLKTYIASINEDLLANIMRNKEAISNEVKGRADGEEKLASKIEVLKYNTNTSLATIGSQLINWSQGMGADYHITVGDGDGSLGAGLKGLFTSITSEVNAVASKTADNIAAQNNQIAVLGGRLNGDEETIRQQGGAIAGNANGIANLNSKLGNIESSVNTNANYIAVLNQKVVAPVDSSDLASNSNLHLPNGSVLSRSVEGVVSVDGVSGLGDVQINQNNAAEVLNPQNGMTVKVFVQNAETFEPAKIWVK